MNVRLIPSSRSLVAAALTVVAACGGGAPSAPAETGSLELAIAAAPADVQCLRLTAQSEQTIRQDVPATPGVPISVTLTGVPAGRATV